jgi:thiol:disulfide interchange protein DsbD
MVTFRKVLAFPMYGAAAWLLWVLTVQAGSIALARLLAAAIVLALGVWLAGLAQARASQGRKPVLAAGLALVLVAAAAAAAVWPPYAEASTTGGSETAEVPYEAYSPERLAALRAEGRPVFVNYTAAWCVTCQVNDRLALQHSGVAEAFKRTNAAYLKADWTRKDAVIAADLASHGRAGVPLYLVYGKGGGDPVVLPQILTEGLVIKAIEKAATS